MMWPQMSREELWVTRLAKLTRGGRCAGLPDNSRTLKFYQIISIFDQKNTLIFTLGL